MHYSKNVGQMPQLGYPSYRPPPYYIPMEGRRPPPRRATISQLLQTPTPPGSNRTWFDIMSAIMLFVLVCVLIGWISMISRIRGIFHESQVCRDLYIGSLQELTSQMSILILSLLLIIIGYVFNWFDSMYIPDNKADLPNAGSSILVRILIQTFDLGSLLGVLLTFSMDRTNSFFYERKPECYHQIFQDLEHGTIQYISFYLLIIETSIKSVLINLNRNT